MSDILTKSVPEKLLLMHGRRRRIQDGTLQCREDWFKQTDETIHHIQWKDIKLWIQQQADDDRCWSELACTLSVMTI
jgi:hypothetical protein